MSTLAILLLRQLIDGSDPYCLLKKGPPALTPPRPAIMEVWPGRCLVAVAAFEYRQVTFEPYNEKSISFLTTYGKKTIPGLSVPQAMGSKVIPSYIWQLPVTSEYHLTGGVDIHALPKFLAEIEFEREGGWIACRLAEKGTEILKLYVPVKPVKPIQYVTYSVESGIPLVANVLVNPVEYGETRAKDAARVEINPEHPIGQALAGMGLSDSPLVYQYSPHHESLLFPARNTLVG